MNQVFCSQKRSDCYNYNNIFYITFFSILSFGKGLGLDFNDKMFLLLGVIASIFLVFQVVLYKYTWVDIFKILFWIGFSIIILANAGKTTVFISIITIILAKNINYNKLMKCIFITRLISFVIVVTLSIIGIIDNDVYTKIDEKGIEILRYSLGFSHPNITFLNFFILVTLYVYLKNKNIKLVNYLVIIISAIVLYKITYSRTGLISIFIVIFFSVLFNRISFDKNKIFKNIIIFIPSIAGVGSLCISYFYNSSNKVMSFINEILTGRLELGHRFLMNYKINLFGQEIIESSNLDGAYLRIDNGYISLILVYGLISFLLFLCIQTLLLKRLFNEKRYYDILLIVVFLIYGISENYIYNIFVNISLIFINDILFNKKIHLVSESSISQI